MWKSYSVAVLCEHNNTELYLDSNLRHNLFTSLTPGRWNNNKEVSYLGLKRLLYADSPLNLTFSALNLRHNFVDIRHFVFSLPEHCSIRSHFLWSLSLHILANVVQVFSTVLLASFDELVELSLRPVCEALRKEKDGCEVTVAYWRGQY